MRSKERDKPMNVKDGGERKNRAMDYLSRGCHGLVIGCSSFVTYVKRTRGRCGVSSFGVVSNAIIILRIRSVPRIMRLFCVHPAIDPSILHEYDHTGRLKQQGGNRNDRMVVMRSSR